MKFVSKIVGLVIFVVVASYYVSMFIMPSITIVNHSGHLIAQAKIILPNNQLDFGTIAHRQQNTLHYSLTQNDGVYRYQFEYANQVIVEGHCGYVTNNQINKRVTLVIKQDNQVTC